MSVVKDKVYYGYSDFLEDMKNISKRLKELKIDAIVAVARGGMIPAYYISTILDNRALFTINSIYYDEDRRRDDIKIFNIPDISPFKNVLVVEDIVDSGKTLLEVKNILKEKFDANIISFSIFYKDKALVKPDIYLKKATAWIDFFWEVDLKD